MALDVPTTSEAITLVNLLDGMVGMFKVGLELITPGQHVPVIQVALARSGGCFYDGKFDDIPNTVGRATKAAADLGATFINVHCSSGRKSLEAAVANKGGAKILGVTVLTSFKDADTREVFGVGAGYADDDAQNDTVIYGHSATAEKVLRFARMAAETGVDGLVCSPQEVRMLRADPKTRDMTLVIPGTRSSWYGKQDQARTTTPAEAITAGADYLVIGRQVTNPPDGMCMHDALRRTLAEIASAMKGVE